MERIRKLLGRVDRFQQERPWLAVPVGTYKKFGDDQAGNLAALIAYYAFASIFPLLLVFFTIVDIVAKNNARLRATLLTALRKQYPSFGQQLEHTFHGGIGKDGIALAIGIVLTVYGARGVASAMQNALNSVWEVPKARRPSFPWSLLRSFGLIGVIGPGMIATIALSGIAGGTGHLGGALAKIAAAVVSLILNVGLFWLGFRLAVSREVPARDLRLSAILAAVFWQVLQLAGGFLVGHTLKSDSAYGIFGVVLGLLAWFYLQAQLTLYVAELNVVRARRLWPRSLAPPPLTDADKRAYEMYAQAEQRHKEFLVEVRPAGDDASENSASENSASENGTSGAAEAPAPPAAAPAVAAPSRSAPPAVDGQRRPSLRQYATRAIRRIGRR